MVSAQPGVKSRGGAESGEARIEGKPRERAGKGSGKELGEPFDGNILEFRTSNQSF